MGESGRLASLLTSGVCFLWPRPRGARGPTFILKHHRCCCIPASHTCRVAWGGGGADSGLRVSSPTGTPLPNHQKKTRRLKGSGRDRGKGMGMISGTKSIPWLQDGFEPSYQKPLPSHCPYPMAHTLDARFKSRAPALQRPSAPNQKQGRSLRSTAI